MSLMQAATSSTDSEVSSKARRRVFTAEYKRKILLEAEGHAASGRSGEIAAMLRREGLYSSHLTSWRQARARGELSGLAPKKRGPPALAPNPLARKLLQVEREVARWKRRAERAEALVEVQKKVSELLGIQLPERDENDESKS